MRTIHLTEHELIEIMKKCYQVGSAAGYDRGRNKKRQAHLDNVERLILDTFIELELENYDFVYNLKKDE